MGTTLIPLFGRRVFTFTPLKAGGTHELELRKLVEVAGWPAGQLLVRVHDRTVGTGASIAVKATTTHPTGEDPGKSFLGSSVSASITSGTDAPGLVKQSLGTGFGAYLRISVVGTQGRTGEQPLLATLSAELAMEWSVGGGGAT